MNKQEIYEKLKRAPNNISYDDITGCVNDFGFRYKGGAGSHRVFVKDGVREILTLQNINGKAKPYQVRQFIKIIEKYQLLKE